MVALLAIWERLLISNSRVLLGRLGNHEFTIFNGLVTSILLETIILAKQMSIKFAFKTAIGMSLISMISMELAMNITDVVLTGGAVLTWVGDSFSL